MSWADEAIASELKSIVKVLKSINGHLEAIAKQNSQPNMTMQEFYENQTNQKDDLLPRGYPKSTYTDTTKEI